MRKAHTDERAKSSIPNVRRAEASDAAERNDVLPSIEIWDCANVNLADWLCKNGTWQTGLKKPRI